MHIPITNVRITLEKPVPLKLILISDEVTEREKLIPAMVRAIITQK